MRLIGLDVHQEFAQVAVLEDGQVHHLGRITTTPAALRIFAQTLCPDDRVVLEATCNTYAIVRLLQQHVARVIVSNPLRTRAIAEAKIKTDKVDAEVLVRLLASGWLPDVWIPDDQTQTLRQQVAHRARLVQQQTRLKNRVHGILHRNLVPGCPRRDLFGKAGCRWLGQHALPMLPLHEQVTVEATLREFDLVAAEVARAEQALAAVALEQPEVRRLMTTPGVDAMIALTIIAAIGDIHRFRSPAKLVSYFGLDPRAAIWRPPCLLWSHYQTGTRACPWHVGRSSVGSRKDAWPPARVLPAHPHSSWASDRRRRRGPQDRGSRLAPAHAWRRLCICPSVAHGT